MYVEKCISRPHAAKRLSDQVLSHVHDIEDLVKIGESAKCCPYYASRYAVAGADMVLLPYQLLLSGNTRSACDIRLEANVVIIGKMILNYLNVFSVASPST